MTPLRRFAPLPLSLCLALAGSLGCGDDGDDPAGTPDAGDTADAATDPPDANDNAAPHAADDRAVGLEDTPVEVAVLENDSDPDGDALAITELGQPSNGSAERGEDGSVRYTPAAGFLGADEFTYTVSDGSATASATVTVEVTPPYTESQFSQGMRSMASHGGRFFHVYQQTSAGDADVYLRTSDDGVSWSDEVRVSDGPAATTQADASLAVWEVADATHVGVLYRDASTANPQLRFAVSTDGGATFSPSVAVSNHEDSNYILGSVAVDAAGNLYAAWARRYSGDRWDQTWMSSSIDGGATWSAPKVIFNGGHYGFDTSIAAAGDGQVCVVTSADVFFKTSLFATCSSDGGANFSETPITDYTTQGWMAHHSSLVTDGDGTFYLSWQDRRGTNEPVQVYFSKSSDGGATWSAPVRVSDVAETGSQLSNDRVATSLAVGGQGRLYVAWADARSDSSAPNFADWNYDVYLSTSEDGGATWSEDRRINDRSELGPQFLAAVAVRPGADSDDVVVSWRDPRLVTAEETRVPRVLYRALTLP